MEQHYDLLSHPRTNFTAWQSQQRELWGSAYRLYSGTGLEGFLVTDEQWAIIPGNTITTAAIDDQPAVVTIAARPQFETLPQLQLNATAAVTANYDCTLKQQKLMREQYDILKKNLISTINPHDLAVLRHPQHALLHVTAKVIFCCHLSLQKLKSFAEGNFSVDLGLYWYVVNWKLLLNLVVVLSMYHQ